MIFFNGIEMCCCKDTKNNREIAAFKILLYKHDERSHASREGVKRYPFLEERKKRYKRNTRPTAVGHAQIGINIKSD